MELHLPLLTLYVRKFILTVVIGTLIEYKTFYSGPAIIVTLHANLPGDYILGVHLIGKNERLLQFFLYFLLSMDQNLAMESINTYPVFAQFRSHDLRP